MQHEGGLVAGGQLEGVGEHRAQVGHVDIARQVLVHRAEGVFEGVSLVEGLLVDEPMDRVEEGVPHRVAQEAGVAGRGGRLHLAAGQLALQQEDEVVRRDLVRAV